MNALEMIHVERARQIQKGYDAAHDDSHGNGEILSAVAELIDDVREARGNWGMEKWIDDLQAHVAVKYGDDYKRRLVIAAAMLAAEIERIDRIESKEPHHV